MRYKVNILDDGPKDGIAHHLRKYMAFKVIVGAVLRDMVEYVNNSCHNLLRRNDLF